MNGLPNIVRERLKMMATAGDHPDPDLLAAFAEQALPDRERTPLLEHLARCTHCRELLVLSAPALESGAVAKDTVPAQKAPWFSWPVLRWGALAACVVIVGTAVLMQTERHSLPVARDVSAPPVLASKPQAQAKVAETSPQEPGGATLSLSMQEPRQAPVDNALNAEIRNKKDQSEEGLYSEFSPGPPATSRLMAHGAVSALAKTPGTQWDTVQRGGASAGKVGAVVPPPPAPSAVANLASTDKGQDLPINSRNLDILSTPTTNETVEVQAATPSVEANSADVSPKTESPGRAKAAGASNPTVALETNDADQSNAPADTRAKALRERSLMFHVELERWTISSSGQVQRSRDSGKSWQPVVVADHATFRALSANGPDLWVGGADGLLYHSADAGIHWTQIKPVADNATLTADIAAIEFTDPQHGKITTANGEAWLTTDAGRSWQKRN